MVSLLSLNAVADHGYKPWSFQTKDYIKLVFATSAKHTALMSIMIKDWLAQNQDNVSELSDMSTHELLFSVS